MLSMLIVSSLTAFAQEKSQLTENAIGIKISMLGYIPEISYQRVLSNENRLDVNVAFMKIDENKYVNIYGTYQWYWSLDNNFYWYAGAGGGLTSGNTIENESKVYPSIHGIVGVEHNFKAPLQIFGEFRPETYLGSEHFFPHINIGARYRF